MTVGRALTLRLGSGRLTAHPPTLGIIASLLGSGGCSSGSHVLKVD